MLSIDIRQEVDSTVLYVLFYIIHVKCKELFKYI